jgi:hypothetical protein
MNDRLVGIIEGEPGRHVAVRTRDGAIGLELRIGLQQICMWVDPAQANELEQLLDLAQRKAWIGMIG